MSFRMPQKAPVYVAPAAVGPCRENRILVWTSLVGTCAWNPPFVLENLDRSTGGLVLQSLQMLEKVFTFILETRRLLTPT